MAKVFQEQLETIEELKSLGTAYKQFNQAVKDVDDYSLFINNNAGETLRNWAKSLFDSRRAVQKPLVALALSAVTAGAGAIIAATSAIAYSVSIALAAYASGRFAAIYRVAQRHNVKMVDLHTNATYYSPRAEIAAAVIPVLASVVAPFVAAASVASQILSYCGTIALRAVYSAVASLTVNALEVQYDTNNSTKPVDPELFASTATQGVKMDSLRMDTLQKVNDTMKSMKACKVPGPTAKEGEQAEELAKPVQDMNAIVDKMVEGKVDQEDITSIPRLVADAKDDKFKSVAKLPQLMIQLTHIYNFAKRVESEGNARNIADDIAREERTAYAANRGVAAQ
jgi:ABC-type multidrug transport system fused ATPase/permease subunit